MRKQHIRCFPIAFFVSMQLVKDIQGAPRRVEVAAVERPGIGEVSPVQTIQHAIKSGNLFVGNFCGFRILEYHTAVSVRYSEIFMLVGRRIYLPQVIRFLQKRLSKPFLRYAPVIRMMDEPRIFWRLYILVCPVAFRFGRVECLENICAVAAADC